MNFNEFGLRSKPLKPPEPIFTRGNPSRDLKSIEWEHVFDENLRSGHTFLAPAMKIRN